MILQALTQYYYERCKFDSRMPRRGWSKVNVAFAVDLDENGSVLQFIPLRDTVVRGNKEVQIPQAFLVPESENRTSGVKAKFLCDNSKYFFGLDQQGTSSKLQMCFEACRRLHEKLLNEVDHPAARAVLRFFANWQCDNSAACFIYSPSVLKETGNFIFRFQRQYVHEIPEIREAWESYYNGKEMTEQVRCLVTGAEGKFSRLHPSFTGLPGAQSSGAYLVSFNADAYCSYGHEQGKNAPTCVEAAYAYGEALKYLLSNDASCCRFDDTLVVCWSGNADNSYSELFITTAGMRMPSVNNSSKTASATDEDDEEDGFNISFLTKDGKKQYYRESDLQRMVQELCSGRTVSFCGSNLDPKQTFYVLGISPNAARLSVRFFMRNSFGKFIGNLEAHRQRLQIYHSSSAKALGTKSFYLPIRSLIWETVDKKSRDKKAVQILVGETLRAVINNEPYPASLLSGVELRIHADNVINRARAAIIKAYYLRNCHPDVPMEVLTVSLNEESRDSAYLLGRLFSALEKVQEAANPGINATIKDRYFNSASSTPGVVFPQLIALAQSHLKKLDNGQKIYYEKIIASIMDCLAAPLPARFNMPQRGNFQLGYYQQTQYFYTPKSVRNDSIE
ncbi:MAG: type I-C CRISPR-associated protein Cas8c/Csd1 [bacterium]|nr:type I-C CRISPR-associated protein Cas8c/Csd1 [bacterium]